MSNLPKEKRKPKMKYKKDKNILHWKRKEKSPFLYINFTYFTFFTSKFIIPIRGILLKIKKCLIGGLNFPCKICKKCKTLYPSYFLKHTLQNILSRIHIAFYPENIWEKTSPQHFTKRKKEILDEKYHDTIKRFGGSTFDKSEKKQKSMIFVGNGDNGKTKLISVFISFLGKENCCEEPLQKLCEDREMEE